MRRRTWTELGGTPILRDLGGEEEPVKETEKEQPARPEETERVWVPGSQLTTVN